MHEACMRLTWKGFMDWLGEESFSEYQSLVTLQSNVNQFTSNDLDPESFNEILENDVLNIVN